MFAICSNKQLNKNNQRFLSAKIKVNQLFEVNISVIMIMNDNVNWLKNTRLALRSAIRQNVCFTVTMATAPQT